MAFTVPIVNFNMTVGPLTSAQVGSLEVNNAVATALVGFSTNVNTAPSTLDGFPGPSTIQITNADSDRSLVDVNALVDAISAVAAV